MIFRVFKSWNRQNTNYLEVVLKERIKILISGKYFISPVYLREKSPNFLHVITQARYSHFNWKITFNFFWKISQIISFPRRKIKKHYPSYHLLPLSYKKKMTFRVFMTCRLQNTHHLEFIRYVEKKSQISLENLSYLRFFQEKDFKKFAHNIFYPTSISSMRYISGLKERFKILVFWKMSHISGLPERKISKFLTPNLTKPNLTKPNLT